MSEVLGYDCNGRPLQAGDDVVIISIGDPTLMYMLDDVFSIKGLSDEGEMLLDHTSYDGYEVWVESEHIRKLDANQPAGSFDEVMVGLRSKEANDVSFKAKSNNHA